jgi:uncharacterized damage-inducible protein DinB
MAETAKAEPWLRGTLRELPAVHRAVLHALQLAQEDLMRWCGELSAQEWYARPSGIAPVAFHVRHAARSMDRLLTYAEGRQLNSEQMAALLSEMKGDALPEEILGELRAGFERAELRIRALAGANLEEPRTVGRQALPTTVGGLLVHVADHTQRHVGQAIITAKLIRAARDQ